MATHSSILAWRIPGKGEPGGLLSVGLHRVSHNWSDLTGAAAKWNYGCSMFWNRDLRFAEWDVISLTNCCVLYVCVASRFMLRGCYL